MCIDHLNEKLARLVEQLRLHAPNTEEYLSVKHEIIQTMTQSGRVWRSVKVKCNTNADRELRATVYQEAVNSTWNWFFTDTSQIQAPVTTVFNTYLYNHLKSILKDRETLRASIFLPFFTDPPPDPLNETLSELISSVSTHPVGSAQQRKLKTQIANLLRSSGRICRWRRRYADDTLYEDALQETWLWFFKHLHEYDATKAKVTVWFNYWLDKNCRKRLGDTSPLSLPWEADDITEEPADTEILTGEQVLSPLDSLVRAEDEQEQRSFFERVRSLLYQHRPTLQRRVRLNKYPQINCWLMLQYRLPWIFNLDEASASSRLCSWNELMERLNAELDLEPPMTDSKQLSRFYNERCLPLIQKLVKKHFPPDSAL